MYYLNLHTFFNQLHGGVHDRRLHDFGEYNHLQCTEADDNILKYLREKEVKSIVLFPICHKAESVNCVAWKDCFADIKWMIDDYINKDLVDSKRIYLGGSSDGGVAQYKHGGDGAECTFDFLDLFFSNINN